MRRLLALPLVALLPSVAAATRIDVGPYLQDVREGGVVVAWETDSPSAGQVVVDENAAAKRFPSTGAATHHEVRLVGLAPGAHRYHVEAGDARSADYDLATAPSAATSDFTLLVYGDNRDRDADHAAVVAAMVREHADLLVHTGDMTGDAGEEPLWRDFFRIEQPLLSSVPMYPALGNHELLHDPAAAHYHRYFVLPPRDGTAGTSEGVPSADDRERYYAFRYGAALFVALDGNHSHERAQADWLVRTLDGAAADPAVRHVFVYFHQPPFSVGDQCGSAAEQGLWVPELEKRASLVRAVFVGHEHAYEHLERGGVRYFVSGGGGAPLHHQSARCPRYDQEALRLFRSTHNFLRVRVRGDQALLDAVASDGQVIESVALHEPAAITPSTTVPYRDGAPALVASVAPSPGAGELPLRALLFVVLGIATLVGAGASLWLLSRRRA